MVRDVLQRAGPALLSRARWQARIVLWIFASLVGAVAVGFARLADLAQEGFRRLPGAAWHWLLPPLGFALVVAVTRRAFRGAEGSGIPQTMHVLHAEGDPRTPVLLGLRVMAGRIGLSLLGLLCGASIGREGPTVHVGAILMDHARRFMPRGPQAVRRHALVMAGGAAGIAAAFNTPLAGIVFAIEELSRSFEERTSGTAMTAVVLAGVMAMALAGNYSYFGTPELAADARYLSSGTLGLALLGGLGGGLFSRLLLWISGGLPGRLGVFQRGRPVLFAGLCGLLVSLSGFVSGGLTFGTGYHEARAAIEGQTMLPWSYAPLRALSTLACLVSGIPGGLFAPSLSVGAGLGQFAGTLIGTSVEAGWPVLGMCAYLAGVTQAPLTAFVIVMEMTGGHRMALPLMLCAAIGTAVSRLLSPSLYRTLAARYVA